MEYNRTYWQAREGTKLNKFTKVNETTSSVELVNSPDAITIAGTEVTTARLNNMESGIDGAVAGVNEIEGVVDFTSSLSTLTGLSQTARGWDGMTTLGDDVYACVADGDIYKQTGGVGDFIALGQASRFWNGMTTRGNDVYACVFSGDIYKQTNGVGDFIALGQASRNWSGMTTRGNYVYAYVFRGDIYKQTGGVGDFIALGQTSRSWRGMTTLGDDVYACVQNGDIYKQTNGVGDFIALGQPTRVWRGMTTRGNYVYAYVFRGDIYTAPLLTGNTFRASSSFTIPAMPDGARKRILNTHATNAITVTAYSGTTIEGQATMTLSAGHEVELELIGTVWRKVVLSQSVTPSAGDVMVWKTGVINASLSNTYFTELRGEFTLTQINDILYVHSEIHFSARTITAGDTLFTFTGLSVSAGKTVRCLIGIDTTPVRTISGLDIVISSDGSGYVKACPNVDRAFDTGMIANANGLFGDASIYLG